MLSSIESLSEVPTKLLESIMEGLAKEPSKWIVMGLGFYVGWQGYDVIKYFVGALKGEEGKGVVNAYVEIQKLAFTPMIYVDAYKLLTGIARPKAKAESAEDVEADPTRSDAQKWIESKKKDIEARMLMGALGALTAAILTTPGTVPGIIQGIGEIVPG